MVEVRAADLVVGRCERLSTHVKAFDPFCF
jgi:hypothetical protein